MQTDFTAERQRLADHYHTMYDGELLALAEDSDGLTDVARAALSDELARRGLAVEEPQPQAAQQTPRTVNPAFNDLYNGGITPGMEAVPLSSGSFAGIVADGEQTPADQEAEFTWKTQLCECEDMAQARMMQMALGRAGIESWVEGRHSMSGILRILVAADQMEAAQAIADRPIPQEIVDELQREVPEFDLPSCPACHAADPILEGVEPANQWLCEACGHRWSDPAGEEQ